MLTSAIREELQKIVFSLGPEKGIEILFEAVKKSLFLDPDLQIQLSFEEVGQILCGIFQTINPSHELLNEWMDNFRGEIRALDFSSPNPDFLKIIIHNEELPKEDQIEIINFDPRLAAMEIQIVTLFLKGIIFVNEFSPDLANLRWAAKILIAIYSLGRMTILALEDELYIRIIAYTLINLEQFHGALVAGQFLAILLHHIKNITTAFRRMRGDPVNVPFSIPINAYTLNEILSILIKKGISKNSIHIMMEQVEWSRYFDPQLAPNINNSILNEDPK